MKHAKIKNTLWILVILALSSIAFAEIQGNQESAGASASELLLADDSTDDNSSEDKNKPTPTLIMARAQNKSEDKVQARTMTKNDSDNIRANIRVQERILEQELDGKSESEQKILQNQNQVRLAVHALLEMENRSGGIGQQVSAIAREFNNSVQATINAEEKIQRRSAIARFFAGGDEASANELEQETVKNQARIQIMTQLKDQCTDCSSEAKLLLEEQIQIMQQEQTRLRGVAEKEKSSKGLFGWIWK